MASLDAIVRFPASVSVLDVFICIFSCPAPHGPVDVELRYLFQMKLLFLLSLLLLFADGVILLLPFFFENLT